MSSRLVLRSGAAAAFAAAFLLLWQFVIAIGIGDEFNLFGKSLDPARMTSFFQMNARAVTQLMTADDAFAIAYALAFIALGYVMLPRNRLLASLALVFSLQTALTDLAENSVDPRRRPDRSAKSAARLANSGRFVLARADEISRHLPCCDPFCHRRLGSGDCGENFGSPLAFVSPHWHFVDCGRSVDCSQSPLDASTLAYRRHFSVFGGKQDLDGLGDL